MPRRTKSTKRPTKKPVVPRGSQRRRAAPAEKTELRNDRERLQKVLAAAGVASRRECEELIREGRVEVDREVVTELGSKVDRRSQEIRVDGELLRAPKLVYYAIHKPPGVLSTSNDPSGRPLVIDFAPREAGRVFNVGRLDASSEGLILVTNDGELANLLTHPRHGVEKTYHVRVAGHVRSDALERLRRGEYLAEGFARVTRVRIKKRHSKSTVLEIVLDEGRNREIRRLLARVGHKVQRLVRMAIGPLRLGQLPQGETRKLTREEVSALRRAAGSRSATKRRPAQSRRRTSAATAAKAIPVKRAGGRRQKARTAKPKKSRPGGRSR